ncbi:glycosyltransferase family 2 protein [Spirosoma sp. 48-14]|uniref:glycosyltransferase family 2 protein n=1 Tax=Spirosoma sp. 48-14 TaxID=1895854 RepID=UPI0009685787|nr:glycosyltransferase family 2 protein [Spirosoma sp. 48-14]OJW78850.1 MAG: hypothetical protein BGO59_10265 [Spirosoma sp. 48-14]
MTLVTIITVCLNSDKHIEQTIQSVLNQSYNNIEYIIIDGKSTDSTLEIIKRYASKHPSIIQYISEPDAGIYNAMNKGIKMAKGELIGIINSDDWYEVNTVENVLLAYSKNGLAVYHGIQRTYLNDKIIGLQCTSSNQLQIRMIEHPTCFLPKELYSTYGIFDENYKYASDYELMLRLQSKNIPFVMIESILANFREGGASHRNTAIWDNYKLWLDKGLMTKKEYLYRSIMDRLRIYLGRR